MKLHEKLYWKIKNWYDVYWVMRHAQGLGCLEHKKDERDFGLDYEKLGWGNSAPAPTKELVDLSNDWVFDQNPLNICVFASNVMASSYQEGKKFSVRFAVIIAKHARKYLGKSSMITGNGYSYLRAGVEIAQKIGRLPYEMMPDEVTMSWEEYSKDIITPEMLAEAANWKTPAYRKVNNGREAVALLEQRYCLLTALGWFQAMNTPERYNYFLYPNGQKIGGHAIKITGDYAFGLQFSHYLNRQTFGKNYGEHGTVKIKDIFGSNFYDVYVMDKIEGRTDAERTVGWHEGQLIKGEGDPIYRVENGMKRGLTLEAWQREGSPKPRIVSEEILNLFPDGELIT